ncbi:MAG: imidazolonepropionase [Betaproteobacteria bacterium]
MVPGTPYGGIDDGALGIAAGRIAWVGPRATLPAAGKLPSVALHDAGGRCITPGLIDCHTHLVYAGNRAHEFEQRLNGVSYEEIARAGGGIASTVTATRAATEDALLAQSAPRLEALLREGVTTIEIKSGYGLDAANEAKMLRVARRLGRDLPVTVRTTFLGAHALPPEFAARPDDYIGFLCETVLPAIVAAGLADAVDAFCETIGFTPAQTERMFRAARGAGLPVKLHAEQLSDQEGAALAARFGALSADHLEHLSPAGIAAMARSGTVAVLLPGSFYFLRDTKLPPVEALRRAAVPVAIATDCNPGTSPTTSLLLMLNMACTLFRMTPAEALAGVTRNAARALGLQDRCGMLQPGMDADFVVWDIDSPGELAYRIGYNPCHAVVRHGSTVTRTRPVRSVTIDN